MEDKIQVIEQTDNKNSKEQVKQKPLKFEKLTPVNLNETEMQGYSEALDFAFVSDDLLNIALSGPYASGKTSIINTYVDLKEIKAIHISLAYFEPTRLENKSTDQPVIENDKQSLEESNQRTRELMLERKILNQLLHQIDTKKIPNTEFRVKHEPNKREVITLTILITILIFFFSYFGKDWFLEIIKTSYILLAAIFFSIFFATGYLVYKLVETQSRRSIIEKLKIFDTELNISSSKKDESYFDKYLDEIIYILEKSEVKAIIFEDIDRYDDNLILSKLRELNCIYNCKQKNNNKIKFIYLIKDEMFVSKDRTKFFDYIIPVVPVIDSANSLSKINEIFKRGGIDKDFKDSTFLYDLSLYLDDIRLIKNIYNEYVIYRAKLRLFDKAEITWLKREKLLAMITYKNLFPKDFSETRLGHGRGVVHRVIKSFSIIEKNLNNDKVSQIDEKITKLNEEIRIAENDHLKNIYELIYLYINLPYEDFYVLNSPDDHGNRTLRSQLSNIDFIRLLQNSNFIGYSKRNDKKELENNFNELKTNREYRDRKIFLEQSKEKYIKEKNSLIQQQEREKIKLLSHRKITEIIRELEKSGQTIEELLNYLLISDKKSLDYKQFKTEYNFLKNSPYFDLLMYFIRKGYIDEYYSDYMSFFYEGGLHRNDTQFIRHIAEYKETDWNLIIYNPEILLNSSRLEEGHFHNKYILNFSLLDYLVDNNHSYLSSFIKTLVRIKNKKFIDEYLFRQKDIIEEEVLEEKDYINKIISIITFIDYINKDWPLFWSETTFDQKDYLYLSFQHFDEDILNSMNKDRKLVKFINEREDFLDIDDKQNWVLYLETTELVFKQLDLALKNIKSSKKELFELVYNNDLYEVNLTNINYILSNVYNLENYESHYLQTIYSLSDQPICKFLEANPDIFMDILLASEISLFNDSEETVINILNNKDVDRGYRIEYAKKISVIIQDLSSINEKRMWDVLLENKKIAYLAKNITYYFFNYEVRGDIERQFNNILVDFINSSDINITPTNASLENILTDDKISELMDAIVVNNYIDNERYNMLLKWFTLYYYTDFSFKNIQKEKISILIKQGILRLTDEQNLDFLREYYQNSIIEIIVNNIDSYIMKVQKRSTEIAEIKKIHPPQALPKNLVEKNELVILLSEDITDDHKLALIALTEEPISLDGLKISEKVKEFILDNNFEKNDLEYITTSKYYNDSSENHKEKIKQICLSYVDDFLKLSIIAYDLLVILLKEESLDINKKYELLANILDKLDAQQAYDCFCILESYLSVEEKKKKEFSKVFIRKLPVFESSSINLRIAQIIENKSWGSLSHSDENTEFFKIIGKRLVKSD